MSGSPPHRVGSLQVVVACINHALVRRFPVGLAIQCQSILICCATSVRSSTVALLERRKLFVIPAGHPCVFGDLLIR